jgi:hypothetical protein
MASKGCVVGQFSLVQHCSILRIIASDYLTMANIFDDEKAVPVATTTYDVDSSDNEDSIEVIKALVAEG